MKKGNIGSLVGAVCTSLILAACGGGGGGTSTSAENNVAGAAPSTTVPNAPPTAVSAAQFGSPAGLYFGTTSTNRTVAGLVQEDGSFYVAYSLPNDASVIGGAVQGTGAVSEGTLKSINNAIDISLQGGRLIPTQLTANYVEKSTFKGSIAYPQSGEIVNFSSLYRADYERAPSLATIAGQYTGESGGSSSTEFTTLTITSSGTSLSGKGSSGCTFAGTVKPAAKGNAYSAKITFGGAPCLLANSTIDSTAYFDVTTKRIYAIALNPERTAGFVFAGSSIVSGGGGSGGNTTVAYQLTARINGVDVPNFVVKPGESKVLGIATGQDVEIIANAPSTPLTSDNGATSAEVLANSSTNYRARFTTTQHTIAKRVFAQSANPLNTAGITITVNSSSTTFGAVTPKVGDRFTYSETDKTLTGNTVAFPLSTHVVTALMATGWNEDFVNPGPTVMSVVNFNSNGNRVGYQATANDLNGCKNAVFNPEEKLLEFPLFQGKTYGSSWMTTCVPDSQLETLTATVGAYEQVTTAGGVFKAFRIETKTVVSNSTDTRLPGRGYEQKVTVWFDPILGRNVKYIGQRTYPLGVPANNVAQFFLTDTNIDLVNTVKN
jgi:hypothetical protein